MDTLTAAFLSGFFLATAILWIIHRKQQQDWQKEYRRLMGGIDAAMIALKEKRPRSMVNMILLDTYNGEI